MLFWSCLSVFMVSYSPITGFADSQNYKLADLRTNI